MDEDAKKQSSDEKLKNDASEEKVSKAEFDKLQSDLNKAKMAENEARNKLKAAEDAKAKAEAEKEAKLKEGNDEIMSIVEQERAKREELEARLETQEKSKELTEAQSKLLEDYPKEVAEIAETTGLNLTNTDEDSIKAFKETLDKISEKVGNGSGVTPNNHGQQVQAPEKRAERIEKLRSGDPNQINEAIEGLSVIKALGNI